MVCTPTEPREGSSLEQDLSCAVATEGLLSLGAVMPSRESTFQTSLGDLVWSRHRACFRNVLSLANGCE